MNQKMNPTDNKPDPNKTSRMEEQHQQKNKAEEKEVAGKHKNDGQKDHKGAR
jgi:hypothetical protein